MTFMAVGCREPGAWLRPRSADRPPLRAGRAVATPGHQSVLVTDGRELALVTGDLLVNALQLLHPELVYSHEIDPEAARHSRERMLGREAATTLHLATPHLTRPFISA